MTDKEMLEMAAKAAGIDWFDEPSAIAGKGLHLISGPFWNPLTDDGDAFRLAVKLGIQISIYLPTDIDEGQTFAHSHTLIGYGTTGYPSYQASEVFSENHEKDPYAATRLAIVRAAAAIGGSEC